MFLSMSQMIIWAQKWRKFVCSSTLSLRFVLSWVCVFLYSLGPWSIYDRIIPGLGASCLRRGRWDRAWGSVESRDCGRRRSKASWRRLLHRAFPRSLVAAWLTGPVPETHRRYGNITRNDSLSSCKGNWQSIKHISKTLISLCLSEFFINLQAVIRYYYSFCDYLGFSVTWGSNRDKKNFISEKFSSFIHSHQKLLMILQNLALTPLIWRGLCMYAHNLMAVSLFY